MSEFKPILKFQKVLGVERGADTLIVAPLGDSFGFRSDDLQTEYNRVYRLLDEPELKNLIIDCEKTDFIDSALVGVFLGLAKLTKPSQGRTILCRVSDRVADILKNMQLLGSTNSHQLWEHVETREAAIAALQSA